MLAGSTRLVGIIGDPVSHSLSPRMQNAAFAARGLDWAYVPLPVSDRQLETAVAGLPALGFAGANVTIPHKTAVIEFCTEIDSVAERSGSVNTLVIAHDRVLGSSTDGLAVTGAVSVEGKQVLILGAGGAARAVATAILDAGAAGVRVASRTQARTLELTGHLRSLNPEQQVDAEEKWPPSAADATIIVNTTPIKDEPIIEVHRAHEVVDLAYRPDGQDTALVQTARDAKCATVVDGLEVLVRQGAASFERWTGVPAPVEVMGRAVRSAP